MSAGRPARWWHGTTAAVAAFGLGAQLTLEWVGAAALGTELPPPRSERLLHFFSYFTVLSNVLVLVTSATLLRRPSRDGRVWRVVRASALTGITVTGVVHWFFLRPLVQLSGWASVTDRILHLAVPALAVVGWLLFGPRPRVTGRVVLGSLALPLVWLAYTLAVGAVSGWYPYPFVDVDQLGAAKVALSCLGLTATLGTVSALLWWGDRRLPPTRVESDARTGALENA